MFGELNHFNQQRIRNTLRRRLRKSDDADAKWILEDDDRFDELCCRLSDKFEATAGGAGVVGSRITDFIDYLMKLDWAKVVEIINIIKTLFI